MQKNHQFLACQVRAQLCLRKIRFKIELTYGAYVCMDISTFSKLTHNFAFLVSRNRHY